jgi:hypothetical protein
MSKWRSVNSCVAGVAREGRGDVDQIAGLQRDAVLPVERQNRIRFGRDDGPERDP